MPEDLKLSQIGSSQLPPAFMGLHSPGVRKHCQIIFAYYFQKSSIVSVHLLIPSEPQCVQLGNSKQQQHIFCYLVISWQCRIL